MLFLWTRKCVASFSLTPHIYPGHPIRVLELSKVIFALQWKFCSCPNIFHPLTYLLKSVTKRMVVHAPFHLQKIIFTLLFKFLPRDMLMAWLLSFSFLFDNIIVLLKIVMGLANLVHTYFMQHFPVLYFSTIFLFILSYKHIHIYAQTIFWTIIFLFINKSRIF